VAGGWWWVLQSLAPLAHFYPWWLVAGGARCSLQELRKLWLRKAEYSETTRILDEMYAQPHHGHGHSHTTPRHAPTAPLTCSDTHAWCWCCWWLVVVGERPLMGHCSEEVKVGWELVERHTQAQSWVPAARVLIRCARIVEQDEMRQIGAIYDIRLFVLDLYHVPPSPSPPFICSP
jgi:hypothetical protein